MSEGKSITLLKAAKELNIGIGTAVDFLAKNGYEIEAKPSTKLDNETYHVLLREFQGDKIVKEEANQIIIGKIRREEAPAEPVVPKKTNDTEADEILIKDTGVPAPAVKPTPAGDDRPKEPVPDQPVEKTHAPGMKIVGKIDLDSLRRGKPQRDTAKAETAGREEEPAAKAPKAEETPAEQ